MTARCEAQLAAHGHVLDASQRQALRRLEDLRRRVLARQTRQSLLQRGLRLLPGKPRARAAARPLSLGQRRPREDFPGPAS